MYEEIYNLCAVRNAGTVFKNEVGVLPPRAQWICDLLDAKGLEYVVEEYPVVSVSGYNIILPGSSNRWGSCHHDIVNAESDNANDNSCSIINAIALKLLAPHINVAILDGEEFGGSGSGYLSYQMRQGHYGVIDWILNLELTGIGGKDFLICTSNPNEPLSQRVKTMFKCDQVRVPFNDSVIFRANGFDSIVINPLPRKEGGELDMSILYRCHSVEDSVDKISIDDMRIFTKEVLLPIVS